MKYLMENNAEHDLRAEQLRMCEECVNHVLSVETGSIDNNIYLSH